ncbi:hypothetical protein ABT065_18870 [Streptomyces sp. NPDC002764]|uniref:hypothetical protein n=1 Tax=Streptomyces sp. NPDC002764 TaxID=3154428 RepID=UPI003320CA3D
MVSPTRPSGPHGDGVVRIVHRGRPPPLPLHTGGPCEARDRHGEFHDPAAGLRGRVFADPAGLLAALAQEVHRHTGDGTTDDMAMLAAPRHAR